MIYQEEFFQTRAECEAFEIAAFTTIGDRAEQQDCFSFHLKETEGLAVLCDGMGGHADGAQASCYAAYHFIKCYRSKKPEEPPADFLNRTIKGADELVSSMEDENGEPLNSGTTAVSILIEGKKMYWCAAGDSRAYLLRNGRYVQFTYDQNYGTLLNEKLRAGEISPDVYIAEQEKAATLVSYVGVGELDMIDCNNEALTLMADDIIAVMSDGLYRMLSDEETAYLLSNFADISDALEAIEMRVRYYAQTMNCERDNMTVMIIKIKNTPDC